MKILVTAKRVVDIELDVHITDGMISHDEARYVINAWDENAIEAALTLKESQQAETVVISLNHKDATDIIRKALAMGIDEGILIEDPLLEKMDYTKLAIILRKLYQDGEYDLVLMGKQAQDTDAGNLGIMLAEMSGLPCICNVDKIEVIDEQQLKIERIGESGKEIITATLPAVLTVSETINEPRLPSVRGIMTAKRKKITTMNLNDLQLDSWISAPNKTEILGFSPVTIRATGRKFEGDPEEITHKVVDLLRNEAKVLNGS